jgi:anti-anti-sigma regulatory factor
MLRITVTQSASSSTRLKLEGRLAGPSVEEVRQLCDANLGNQSLVILDLGDVTFIDDDGVDLFRHLRRRNIEVTGCSPFVSELLKEVWPCS